MKARWQNPAIIIAMVILFSFGTISIGHLIIGKPLRYLNQMETSGFDYQFFFLASQNLIAGSSPYNVPPPGYVTTPIPAIFNLLFIPIGFTYARFALLFLIPASIAIGFLAISATFNFSKNEREEILFTGIICLIFGYPFYFLLERGNIDGWVLLFLCLGLFFFQKPKKEWLSGLFFSLGIFFKIYPILIILPIFIYKKWRILLWLGLWMLLWGIFSIFWIADFQDIINARLQSTFRFDENGSLVATIALISLLINASGLLSSHLTIVYAPFISAIIYGVLISLVIYTDYRLSKANRFDLTSLILYIPFMVALPQIVYHYSLIICLVLIPALSHLWQTNQDNLARGIILLMTIGLSLTQIQGIALFNLTQNIIAQGIPGLGLLLVLVGIGSYKLLCLRRTPHKTASD